MTAATTTTKHLLLVQSVLLLITLSSGQQFQQQQQQATVLHPNQKVRITGGTKDAYHFSYEDAHEAQGESYLHFDPQWQGEVFFPQSSETFVFGGSEDTLAQTAKPLQIQQQEFTLTPAERTGSTELAFSVVQKTSSLTSSQALVNEDSDDNLRQSFLRQCSNYADLQSCMEEQEFCLTQCHYVTCGTMTSTTNTQPLSFMAARNAHDSSLASLCGSSGGGSSDEYPIRYELGTLENEAIPALVIFILTILTGLLIVFVAIVLHYNCIAAFRNKLPYRLPCSICCTCSELYFPKCINEEQMKHVWRTKAQSKKQPGGVFETSDGRQIAHSQTTGGLIVADGLKIDLHSDKGDSDEIDESPRGYNNREGCGRGGTKNQKKGHRDSDAVSDFKLDDDITQAINRNFQDF